MCNPQSASLHRGDNHEIPLRMLEALSFRKKKCVSSLVSRRSYDGKVFSLSPATSPCKTQVTSSAKEVRYLKPDWNVAVAIHRTNKTGGNPDDRASRELMIRAWGEIFVPYIDNKHEHILELPICIPDLGVLIDCFRLAFIFYSRYCKNKSWI